MVWFLNKPTTFSPDSSQTRPPCSGEWEILAIWTWAVWCQLASRPESSPWPILFACVMQSDSPSEKTATVQFKGTSQSPVNDHSDAVEVCQVPALRYVTYKSSGLSHTTQLFSMFFSVLYPKSWVIPLAWPLHGLWVCVGAGGGISEEWGEMRMEQSDHYSALRPLCILPP